MIERKLNTISLLMIVLAIAIAGYSVVQYFILDARQAGLVQFKLMFTSTLNTLWYVVLFIHILFGIATLVIGPFTLLAKFREKNIQRHRLLGKAYLIGILFGGMAGLYLALYATGGLVAKFGFGSLSIIWICTAFLAFTNVRNKKIQEHQKWMIRNYSLTFAAVTLRIWLFLFTLLFGFEHFIYSYAVIAWISWVPNLVIAEWLIRKKLKLVEDHNYVNETIS